MDEDDGGMKVLVDGDDNIYALGATFSVPTDHDVILYKYNSTGALLWSITWDAGNNLGDVPVDMVLDDGDAYITGIANTGNENTTSDDDSFILKVSATGNIDWSTIYDYSDENDAGINVKIDDDYAYVACNSHDDATTKNRTLIKYDKSTGNQEGSALRETSTGNEYWADMIWHSNNLILAGRKNMDAIVASYDPDDFSKNWELTNDEYGFGDAATQLLSANNNIYVGGEADGNLGRRGKNLRIKANGDLLSKHKLESMQSGVNTQIADLTVMNNHPLYLYKEIGSTKTNSYLLWYDKKLNSLRAYYCPKGFEGHTVVVNGSKAFVSGTQKVGSAYKAAFMAIETHEFMLEHDYDTTYNGDTNAVVQPNQVGILVKPGVLNLTNSDNTYLEAGKLSDFFTAGFVADIEDSTLFDEDSFLVYKTFKHYTSADTTRYTKRGKPFRSYDYYCSYRIILPQTLSTAQFLDDIENLTPIRMEWQTTEPVAAHSMDPNDGWYWENYQFCLYSNPQSSFWNTSYQNQSIRVRDAWKYSTGGKQVKVGIFEPASFSRSYVKPGKLAIPPHSDLSLDNSFTNSVITSGQYNTGLPIDKASDLYFSQHANQSAGLVGAIRNNKRGSVGVAGGTGSNLDGVSLQSYGALAENLLYAMDTGKVHIINQSFAGGTDNDYINTCLDAYKQGVTFISSAGNNGTGDSWGVAAKLTDYTMGVGGSGIDGKYRKASNSGHSNDVLYSSYGNRIDVIAPASQKLNSTTSAKYEILSTGNNGQ
ncbi:MAG: hypothetical protein KDC92_06280, partial [Bacteroidetes bacterium]|nr:hypothetical protein [Bacteroidota bacterium]